MADESTYFAEHALKLVGYKVSEVAVDAKNDMYALVMTKGRDKKVVWVLCDPEGNGPGFLEIADADTQQVDDGNDAA